ncbi:MAG: 1-acyl-sn-glycerol-3-phosphate acyltransferase, partial [Mycobacterium sp.]
LVTARRTVVHVQVQSLELPGEDRRDLEARCEAAVRGTARRDVAHGAYRAHGHELAA